MFLYSLQQKPLPFRLEFLRSPDNRSRSSLFRLCGVVFGFLWGKPNSSSTRTGGSFRSSASHRRTFSVSPQDRKDATCQPIRTLEEIRSSTVSLEHLRKPTSS